MKLIRPITSGLVACVVLTMLTALAAQAAEQSMAKVVNIRGAARYMTAENPTWRPLKTGALLKSGTTVQTAADSYVDVVLYNPNATSGASVALSAASSTPSISSAAYSQPKVQQDAIRIFENTVLGIDKLTLTQTGADKVTETQLDLKAGRILGTVKKLSAASKYEVKIPNGVAGIRGTIYTLSADGILGVISGSVVLAYVGPDGNPVTKEVNAGQQYDAKTGLISNLDASAYNGPINALQGGPNMPPATFTVDHTVYFVSPTVAGSSTPPPQEGQRG